MCSDTATLHARHERFTQPGKGCPTDSPCSAGSYHQTFRNLVIFKFEGSPAIVYRVISKKNRWEDSTLALSCTGMASVSQPGFPAAPQQTLGSMVSLGREPRHTSQTIIQSSNMPMNIPAWSGLTIREDQMTGKELSLMNQTVSQV